MSAIKMNRTMYSSKEKLNEGASYNDTPFLTDKNDTNSAKKVSFWSSFEWFDGF
jgi:hypothetical protein